MGWEWECLNSFCVVRRICQYVYKVGKDVMACTITPYFRNRGAIRPPFRNRIYLNVTHPQDVHLCLFIQPWTIYP